jgi:hypothetical protein
MAQVRAPVDMMGAIGNLPMMPAGSHGADLAEKFKRDRSAVKFVKCHRPTRSASIGHTPIWTWITRTATVLPMRLSLSARANGTAENRTRTHAWGCKGGARSMVMSLNTTEETMTTKRNVKNASIMSGAVLLAVMFGYPAVSGGNLEGPGRQVWKDEPTITVKLSNGQETVLKHVGIGMRAGTPGTWKNYLDPKDTLSDAMTYPESPNEALVPVYALSQYALEPEKLDRRDADPHREVLTTVPSYIRLARSVIH